MKKNMNESPIELVSAGSDFNGFGEEMDDGFVNTDETPIERVDNQVLNTAQIDEFVKAEDYMGLQDYLDGLDEDQQVQAHEYIQNNYPEFLQDEEGATFEPMKGNTSTDKQLYENFGKKTNFDKKNIKSELGDVLFESYRDAA